MLSGKHGLQAALAWWSTVSPFSPFGPTIALLFVLLVAAGKAIIEDKKRHREDRLTNNSIAHVVNPDGTYFLPHHQPEMGHPNKRYAWDIMSHVGTHSL